MTGASYYEQNSKFFADRYNVEIVENEQNPPEKFFPLSLVNKNCVNKTDSTLESVAQQGVGRFCSRISK